MRTIEYRTAHVPAFLTKLWKLVTDPNSDDLISWNVNGSSFIIYDEIRFAKELLPMYFKHNNMASFVRQLNMYGFRKLSCIDQGGMHTTKHEIEFYHQYFLKNQESLLDLIKRKIPSNRLCEDSKSKPTYVKELLTNIKNLQGKQQSSEEGMKNLRRENKLLWQQLTLLNGRYVKQQAMLQQVLPLFMNMMHSSHRIAIKRRPPLMIDDGDIKEKARRIEQPQYYVEQEDSNLSPPMTHSPGNVSNRGPVIHDVTEMEGSKMFADNILCSPNTPNEHDVIVDSPLSSLESSDRTSPYTDGEAMEPISILNCNFGSLQPMATKHPSSMDMANQANLIGRDINMSSIGHQRGNLNPVTNLHTVSSSELREYTTSPIQSPPLKVNAYQCRSFRNTMQTSFTTVAIDETSNHESPVASVTSYPSATLIKDSQNSFPAALLDESANHGSPISPVNSYPSAFNVEKQFADNLLDESSNHNSTAASTLNPIMSYGTSTSLNDAQKHFTTNLLSESLNRTSPVALTSLNTTIQYPSAAAGNSSQKVFPVNLLNESINNNSPMAAVTTLKTNTPFQTVAADNMQKPFPKILLDNSSNQHLNIANATVTANSSSGYQPITSGNLLKTFPAGVSEELLNQANLPGDMVSRIENALGWFPSGNDNEENFDRWLGQLVRADNLTAGASLPSPNALEQKSIN